MNEKILVVDDEAAIVDLIKMELDFEGYQVETAYDGQEAIEKAQALSRTSLSWTSCCPRSMATMSAKP